MHRTFLDIELEGGLKIHISSKVSASESTATGSLAIAPKYSITPARCIISIHYRYSSMDKGHGKTLFFGEYLTGYTRSIIDTNHHYWTLVKSQLTGRISQVSEITCASYLLCCILVSKQPFCLHFKREERIRGLERKQMNNKHAKRANN